MALSPLQVASTLLSPIPYNCAIQPGNDLFVSGGLFHHDEVLPGARFDDQTMAEISQLLYNDPYGFIDGAGTRYDP
jgi:hypothetical protein